MPADLLSPDLTSLRPICDHRWILFTFVCAFSSSRSVVFKSRTRRRSQLGLHDLLTLTAGLFHFNRLANTKIRMTVTNLVPPIRAGSRADGFDSKLWLELDVYWEVTSALPLSCQSFWVRTWAWHNIIHCYWGGFLGLYCQSIPPCLDQSPSVHDLSGIYKQHKCVLNNEKGKLITFAQGWCYLIMISDLVSVIWGGW